MSAKVLVIDDDETAREIVRALLTRAGFSVVVVSTPIGATRLIREIGIDAVVCDLNMPAMQGDSLARLFRSSKALRAVRLVLMSGASHEELGALLFQGSVDAVVHKSDLQRELVSKLRALLPAES